MVDRISELEQKLAASVDIRERVDTLNALAWEIGYFNISRSIELSEEARQLSTSGDFANSPYLSGLARSLLNLSRANTELGNYSESIPLLLQAQPMFETLEDNPGLTQVLNEFGRIYYYLSDFPTAIEYYMQEIVLARQIGDVEREAATLYNIGLIHLYSDNYKMALEDLGHALTLAENLKDWRLQAFALEGLAETYSKMGELQTALEYAAKSLDISRPTAFYGLMNNTLLTLGDIYTKLGDLDRAETCYKEALETAEASGSRHDTAYAVAATGKMLMKRGRQPEALETLYRALSLAEDVGSRDLVFEIHLALSEVFKKLGDFQKALEHYEQFHSIEKALFNEKSDMKLKTLEVLHRVEGTRRESEIYQLKNALLQQEIEEHKKVQAVLEELVKTDPLTGLFNRRHFYDLGEKEFKRVMRYRHAFSVIMADIDHFKEINDRFGHAVGDQALVMVASLIRRNLRSADVVCRYGGEEFAFLLPETNGLQALQVADRIRTEIAAYPFHVGDEPFQISISLGVAERPESCKSLDQLFIFADQALYDAKKQGRNRVSLYTPS